MPERLTLGPSVTRSAHVAVQHELPALAEVQFSGAAHAEMRILNRVEGRGQLAGRKIGEVPVRQLPVLIEVPR